MEQGDAEEHLGPVDRLVRLESPVLDADLFHFCNHLTVLRAFVCLFFRLVVVALLQLLEHSLDEVDRLRSVLTRDDRAFLLGLSPHLISLVDQLEELIKHLLLYLGVLCFGGPLELSQEVRLHHGMVGALHLTVDWVIELLNQSLTDLIQLLVGLLNLIILEFGGSKLRVDLNSIVASLRVKELGKEVVSPLECLLTITCRDALGSQAFKIVELCVLDRLSLYDLLGFFEALHAVVHLVEKRQDPRAVSDDPELELPVRHRNVFVLLEASCFELGLDVGIEIINHSQSFVVEATLLDEVDLLQVELAVTQLTHYGRSHQFWSFYVQTTLHYFLSGIVCSELL